MARFGRVHVRREQRGRPDDVVEQRDRRRFESVRRRIQSAQRGRENALRLPLRTPNALNLIFLRQQNPSTDLPFDIACAWKSTAVHSTELLPYHTVLGFYRIATSDKMRHF